MEGKNNLSMIVLVGPKHVGKTSVGKALAERLGWPFLDLDDLIAETEGKSPRDVYREGPEVFRAAEEKACRLLASRPERPLVVAAGGGLIDNPRALALIRAEAVLVALELSAPLAWERVHSASILSGSLPPFLQGDNPEEKHRALHERRQAEYREEADLCIESDASSPVEIAHVIASVLLDRPR